MIQDPFSTEYSRDYDKYKEISAAVLTKKFAGKLFMLTTILYILGVLLLSGLLGYIQSVARLFIARGSNPAFRRRLVILVGCSIVQIGAIYAAFQVAEARTGVGDFSDTLASSVYYISIFANIAYAFCWLMSLVLAIKARKGNASVD